MRIAVIFDSISPESGGNFYQSLQSAMILNSIQKIIRIMNLNLLHLISILLMS